MGELLTPSKKRSITRDWADRFGGLGVHRPMHLLRLVGPMLQGIALERGRSNDRYLPMSHVHCLANEFSCITLTLARPLLTERTRAPDGITVRLHASRYLDAASRLERQSTLPLAGPVSVDSVVAEYRRDLATPANSMNHHLYEDMIAIFTWLGRHGDARSVLEEASTAMQSWPPSVVTSIGSVAVWRRDAEARLLSIHALEERFKQQREAHGSAKLPVAELV